MTVVLAVVGVLTGLALGRFATFDADPRARRPAAWTDPVTVLERRLVSAPDDVQAWRALGVHYVRRGNATGDPTAYAQAERAIARADELEPDAPSTALVEADLALALHDFRRARHLGTLALDGMPRNADALGVLVDANVELGDYDAAATHLAAMLDRRPALPALARASYLRELHGDLDGAVDAMRQAEVAGSATPTEAARVAALLGDLERRRGRPDAAADAYGRALAVDPTQIEATIGSARLEIARGELDAAVERLSGLVDRFPRPDAVILLGDLHAASGRRDEAADAYELARGLIALQADAGQTVDLELALFEADHGDAAHAVALAETAYDARPDNVYAADALAWARFRAGDTDGAVELVAAATRLGTADPELRYHAAAILTAAQRPDEARQHLAWVIGSDPWFSLTYRSRAGRLAHELGLDVPAAWETG